MLFLMSCMHMYVATPSYNLCSYLAMARATGSTTDSMAQDGIFKKKPFNQQIISFLSAHLGKRKQYPVPSNLLGLPMAMASLHS